MARLSCLALLALLLGLAGCSTTVFQSLPEGSSTDCDPAWPGRWQPVASADEAVKPKDAVEFSADCRTATVKGEAKPVRLTRVDTGKARYLQLHNDSGEPDCIGPGKTRCGAVLLRYEREGDIIRIYDVDHAKVAAAINGKKIDGHTINSGMRECPASQESEKVDEKKCTPGDMVNNYIAGDGKRIAKLLRKHPEFFTGEPLMVLRRAPAEAPPATEPPAGEH